MSSWLIVPFITMLCSSLSLVIFYLKSTLHGINKATPAFLREPLTETSRLGQAQ